MTFNEIVQELGFEGVAGTLLTIVMFILLILIIIAALVSIVVKAYLAIKYLKYNHQKVESKKLGRDVARELLDKNGMENIKVVRASVFTAFTVGNSYSHYFKRVRLRGLIYDKASLTSVAVAGEKVGLGLLDKEGDKEMKKRIKLTPIIMFGPLACIPLALIGVIIDIIVFNSSGVVSLIAAGLGIIFYAWAFVLSCAQLKTEKKAQEKALVMLSENGYLNAKEIEDAKELFKLYNIDYILQEIIALLELILKIVEFLLKILETTGKFSLNKS